MTTNVRRAVLFVVLGLLGMVAPGVAQTCRWSAVGGGTIGVSFALAVFDDGSGPALYAWSTLNMFSVAKWSCQ